MEAAFVHTGHVYIYTHIYILSFKCLYFSKINVTEQHFILQINSSIT
jgi:hypothetical protein